MSPSRFLPTHDDDGQGGGKCPAPSMSERTMRHVYPPELTLCVRKAVSEATFSTAKPTLPPDDVLADLLTVAFQASLLTEEGRRPGFRILFASRDEIWLPSPEDDPFGPRGRILGFEKSRPFSAAEVARIAPAAELTRLMICTQLVAGSLVIWGLLDTGENWWRFINHEYSGDGGGFPPPNNLTLSSAAAGELSISAAGTIFVSLRGGEVIRPAADAFRTGPIADFFADARTSLYREVTSELARERWDDEGQDDDYPRRFYTNCLEGILNAVREKRHGGSLIVLPDSMRASDSRLLDRAATKYSCDYNELWPAMKRHLVNHQKYYDLHFPLWDGKTTVSTRLFRKHSFLEMIGRSINEQISDIRRTIASLTAVDGAVLITDRFRVLGFGCEVRADSPTLAAVKLANDPTIRIPIDGFGTRHRSAFRFCSSFEDSVALIVSQDGGVKAVKRVDGDVLFWPDINPGGIGI